MMVNRGFPNKLGLEGIVLERVLMAIVILFPVFFFFYSGNNVIFIIHKIMTNKENKSKN